MLLQIKIPVKRTNLRQSSFPYARASRYIAVEYNMVLNTMRKEECQHPVQTMDPEKTPDTSPLWASYGAPFLSSLENIYHEISRVHCIT